MTNQVQTCTTCGGTQFTKGRLDGYAKVNQSTKHFL